MAIKKASKKTVKKTVKKAAKKPAKKKAVVRKKSGGAGFKLTYATMFNPPEALHSNFEKEVAKFRAGMGKDVPMFINGEDRYLETKFDDRSPINTDWLLGKFQKGGVVEGQEALAAARKSAAKWAATKWQDRVRILRKAAGQIEKRLYEIAAIVSIEIGKNRMEALGDVQETADLISYYCDQMDANNGYIKPMGRDPLAGYNASNVSALKPYGVWVVVSPFNFPFALAGGPTGAALVAGNAVVFKPASDTPYSGRMLAECYRDAGVPAGVFNYVTGGGSTLGEELITNPEVDGITFTGSYDVGMHIYKTFATGKYPRPCIAEMGGKNPAIISKNADLDVAVQGVVRSAFGLQGQKCSACSRIYVHNSVKDKFIQKLVDATNLLKIGDPTLRENFLGPVANASSYQQYGEFVEELGRDGRILTGGRKITEGDYGKGYFAAPTLAEVPMNHRLWKTEMFLPISTIGGFDTLDEAMAMANDVDYGLTAGFYGSKKELQWFFDHIQAGVTYANRPQGATTGAWPGFQPFGGWKGSGSTGKAGGSLYYVQQFMHEQSQTIIEKA